MIVRGITTGGIIHLMRGVQGTLTVAHMMRGDTAVIASRTTITIVDIVPLSMIREGVMTVVDITQEAIMEEAILEGVITHLQVLELREEVTNLRKRKLYEKDNIDIAVFCGV